jgi:hypothetical protein
VSIRTKSMNSWIASLTSVWPTFGFYLEHLRDADRALKAWDRSTREPIPPNACVWQLLRLRRNHKARCRMYPRLGRKARAPNHARVSRRGDAIPADLPSSAASGDNHPGPARRSRVVETPLVAVCCRFCRATA